MTEHVELPMVCIHDPQDQKDSGIGTRKADDLRDEVYEMLSDDSDVNTSFRVNDRNFLTCVVYALNLDYDAQVAGIHSDMWHRVVVEKCTWNDETKTLDTTLRVTCECDRVEDGLAAIYKWFRENREIDE